MKILEMLGSGLIGVDSTASASTVICELSNQFVRRGHNVSVADVRSDRKRRHLDPRIEVIEIDVPSPIYSSQPVITGIYEWIARKIISRSNYLYLSDLIRHHRYVKAVASKLSFDDFDIVHVHYARQAIFLRKKFCRSYFYTNHWCYQAGDRSLDARIERMVIKRARKTVGLGSYLKRFAPEEDIEIIPHGIELENFIPLDKIKCRETIGESKDTFIIVFVGFVGRIKGVHTLVGAISHLFPELNKLKAYIIGPTGPNAEKTGISNYAQKLMDDSKDLPIRFLGFLNNTSLAFRQYISAADVFVLPSLNEAQGLSALEALAMGKPVIASDVGGLGEMITEEVGYVVKPGDVSDLSMKIRHLYNNPEEVEKLERNCRNYVERNYTWRSSALRYIELFKS